MTRQIRPAIVLFQTCPSFRNLLNVSFTNNYLTMWNHYICFHPRTLAFVDITPRKQQSSKFTTTLSWSLTLASLQLCCCWVSLLLSTVSITPFSSKFSNCNLVSLPQLCSGSFRSLPQGPTVLNSVVPHKKSFLFFLVSLKVQLLVHSSLFCTPRTL